MNILIEFAFSIFLTVSILVQLYRRHLLQKKTNLVYLQIFSTVSLCLGLYLWVKNGLIVDYGTIKEQDDSFAFYMLFLGLLNLGVSSLFFWVQIFKILNSQLNRNRNSLK